MFRNHMLVELSNWTGADMWACWMEADLLNRLSSLSEGNTSRTINVTQVNQ